VQARSAATVDAILDATLQVLVTHGKDKLTTTRVAERAGASVGTLYQYYPNKTALLQAVLLRKLEGATAAIERACAEHSSEPLPVMLPAVVDAFFRAKMRDPRGSLALYTVSSDINAIRVTEHLRERSTKALVAAIQAAPERYRTDPESMAFVLQGALTGLSRRILEARLTPRTYEPLIAELSTMFCAYVEAQQLATKRPLRAS
jgi:AcrR family transcriptional regulator